MSLELVERLGIDIHLLVDICILLHEAVVEEDYIIVRVDGLFVALVNFKSVFRLGGFGVCLGLRGGGGGLLGGGGVALRLMREGLAVAYSAFVLQNGGSVADFKERVESFYLVAYFDKPVSAGELVVVVFLKL